MKEATPQTACYIISLIPHAGGQDYRDKKNQQQWSKVVGAVFYKEAAWEPVEGDETVHYHDHGGA